jgi:hypothetical protein
MLAVLGVRRLHHCMFDLPTLRKHTRVSMKYMVGFLLLNTSP